MSVDAEKTEAKGGVRDTVRVVIHALILALVVRVSCFSRSISVRLDDHDAVDRRLSIRCRNTATATAATRFRSGSTCFLGGCGARSRIVATWSYSAPRDNQTDYIKRVIGLPGDEIQMLHGWLNNHGNAVPRSASTITS